MSDPAEYSPLSRLAGIQIPWQLVDKNACRRLALLIGKGAFIALLYYLLVVISMKLHFSTSGLSLIWPSNALLAATLVLSPKSRWWFYLLAIIPAHIAGMSPYNLGLWWLVYQIAFNSALTATYAAILQRFKPEILYFEALRDVLIFLGVSVAVPVLMNWVAIYPVFKFSPSSSALLAHNSSGGFFAVWTSCWINNSASFIAFVPAILVCATRGSSWFRGFSSRRVAEGALLTVLFIMGTFLVYGRIATNGDMVEALYLIPISFLLWAAVRFGPAGASLSVTALVCISSWCAYAGEGPFLRSSSIDRVTSMQISWIMICAPVLALAAVVRERKFATLAFLKSEGRFRQFFETQPECCYMVSPEGIVLDVNPAACEALGYTKEELIGKPISMPVPPELLDEENKILEKLKSGDRIENFETVRVTKTGKRINVSLTISPIKDSTGRTVGISGIARDITERKLAEEALRASEERLRLAQQAARIGTFDWNIRTGVNTWTPELEAMYGLPPGSFGGTQTAFENLVHPDDRAGVFKLVDAAMKSGQPTKGEWRVVWADGSVHWIAGHWQVFMDASGEPSKMIGVNIDVTERKLADEAHLEVNRTLEAQAALLQSREELLKIFVKHVPAAVAMLDRDMRYLQVSDRWCTDYLRGRAEVLGCSHYEIFPDMPERWKEVHRRGLQGETLRDDEDRWDGQDGPHWARWEVRPWKTPEGTVGGILILTEDITRRKQAEEALLGMSRKLIEAQDQERTRIARELHDDINQRLALLAISLVKLQHNPSSKAEITKDIAEAIKQVQDLGSDVQAISHHLHSSKLEYLGLAAAAAGFCREVSNRQGVEIDFQSENIPKDLPMDASLCLFRVLQEAIQNATKHSGSRHFEVSLSSGLSEIELTVRDSGIGFNPEEAMKGTGLGLTSIRERLKLVNGDLSIDSQPQRGTTIHARVPLTTKMKNAGAVG